MDITYTVENDPKVAEYAEVMTAIKNLEQTPDVVAYTNLLKTAERMQKKLKERYKKGHKF